MVFCAKILVALATAIVSVHGYELNKRDPFPGWEKQGQCYVTSRVYPVSHKSDTTGVSTGTSTVSQTTSQTASVSSSSLSTSPTDIFASCPAEGLLSCSNTTAVEDLCCFESPGGVVLLTQFWDYSPTTGPVEEFTIHGLWPDNCDGSYGQYCDPSLEITNPGQIVKQFDEGLYEEMTKIWKDESGNDESLWYHEYNKHGTCYSTLKPECYGHDTVDPNDREDVYDYYKTTVNLHKQYTTFEWLVAEGIVPSANATYTLQEVQDALTKHYGYLPYIGCDKNNSISEIWYFHHVRGSIRQDDFVKMDTLTKTKCPATGIKFPPKDPNNTPAIVPPGTLPSTVSNVSGIVALSGTQNGCLTSSGEWSTNSCGTFTFTQLSTGSYYLKSSSGNCGLQGTALKCGSDIAVAFEFNYDSGLITANGSPKFSAASAPSGSSNSQVSAGGAGALVFNLTLKSS